MTTVKHLLQEPADPNCRDPQTHKSPIVKAGNPWASPCACVCVCVCFFPSEINFCFGAWEVYVEVVQVKFVFFSRFVCLLHRKPMFMVEVFSKSELLIA